MGNLGVMFDWYDYVVSQIEGSPLRYLSGEVKLNLYSCLSSLTPSHNGIFSSFFFNEEFKRKRFILSITTFLGLGNIEVTDQDLHFHATELLRVINSLDMKGLEALFVKIQENDISLSYNETMVSMLQEYT